MSETVGYKFLVKSGTEVKSYLGNVVWSVPQNGIPGEWHKHTGVVAVGRSGFHASTLSGSYSARIFGDILCQVESRGIIDKHPRMYSASEMRLVRLFEPIELAAVTAMIHDIWVNKYVEINPEDSVFRTKYSECIVAIVSEGFGVASSKMGRLKTGTGRNLALLDSSWKQVSRAALELGDVAVKMSSEQLQAYLVTRQNIK